MSRGPGLCPLCRHVLEVTSARGSSFWRCRRHDDDPRFAKYPRLPVVSCPGYEPGASTPGEDP